MGNALPRTMQLTRAADYAVRVMIHLARLEPGMRASRGELAAAAECPEQFLAKVLQSLTHAGLVVSHRGNTGGFEIPATGRDSSLLEVVEALEGPIQLNICLGAEDCKRKEWCPAHPIWAEAQRALLEVLRSKSIRTLAEAAGPVEPAVSLI
jgi:Rrf2 family iron-sulfur cluster assembly transcriptional regulator